MKIVTLSTYSADEPLHGGQHRLHNIAQSYQDAGNTVQMVGVLGSELYPAAKGFLPYPGMPSFAPYIENSALMDDWAIGQLFERDDQYFNQLADLIEAEPDVIHVEQPWLFGFAKRYVSQRTNKSAKIVYGSQNIEHELKYKIVKTYLGVELAEDARRRVLRCELAAIAGSDAICCVSENDLDWTRKHARVESVLAANGVKRRDVTEAGLREANKISGNRKFALYCGSAHPPNITGFYDIFGKGLGCIAPNERIVIAGGAGESIKGDPRFPKTAGLGNACVVAGMVSEDCLQGLIETAHSIILPITQGGGTNLKTAEALWAGKHIVATPTAMRGFEQFSKSPGVSVFDEPPRFLRALRERMSAPANVLTPDEKDQRECVLWENTLRPLVSLVSRL
ncbi:glycosyltransferase [Paraburkholderia phenazinium]|uniref:Uncharacterized protein n=1 Tax=Paraburkholderia phenazinium TaxID=60549 RepID=A0A1G8E172_9BURK|nr:glycosyltransferase [Paraburkholderia phenazinium]SDH63615.1 hypothetical protein SAMN05216466_111236 [Paraburkholderia phenazinium]